MKKKRAWIKKHWTEVIMVLTVLLVICYIVGYFLNGLYGAAFDLGSIWVGVTAVTAWQVSGIGKYYVDSRFNTDCGKPPDNGDA